MAIAFDAASGPSGTASGTEVTLSHTTSGSNRLLFVAIWNNNTSQTFTVTYNGVAMTQVASRENAGAGIEVFLFALQAPATGANNIVATASGTTNFFISGASYTGAQQSVTMDATAVTTSAAGTSHAHSVTTVADNCWVVGAWGCGSGAVTWTAGASTTARAASGGVSPFIADNNAPKTPAGSVTLTATSSGSQTAAITLASFAPASAGPAGVKTLNGITLANVKTVNGIAIASVKTINGIA